MKRSRGAVLAAVLAMGASALAACGGGDNGDVVRLATGVDPSYSVVFVAEEKGYFKDTHPNELLGKNYFYNESLQVPLLVRGPGVDEGRRSSRPVTAVDLVPTLAELAGAEPGRVVDGKSFLPILQGQTMRWRRHQRKKVWALIRPCRYTVSPGCKRSTRVQCFDSSSFKV